jgi:cob(I)alamin adenosyltransferase
MTLRQGLIQVYTGNGKGKTTAALGLALRAVGHGLRVIMFQFLKGNIAYGELQSAQRLEPLLKIVPCGRDCFVKRHAPDPEDVRLAREGLQQAARVLQGEGDYTIVILDEINCAVDFGLLHVEEVLHILEQRREGIEVVLTGRGAHPKFIEKADLVTEMAEVKHYYKNGVDGRVGIER